ncbi:MAG: GatB/YqeY domain-containing protein [Paracoccaceae bacterium]
MRARITDALKEAMRSGDPIRIGMLRLMIAALKDREAALRMRDGPDELVDADVIALLSRMIAQREVSVATYEQAGRMELAEQERAEIKVIREFLPRPLTEDEVRAEIRKVIEETGANSVRDMGKVMATLKARHAGRMDFAAASAAVKTALG